MERTLLDDGSRTDGRSRCDLSDELDTSDVAVVHYRIPPDEGFPSGLHAHVDQEELFVIRDGTATFETITAGDGSKSDEPWDSNGTVRTADTTETETITVEAGEAIRFAPGEFQTGDNAGEEPLVALALGAPRESDDVRFPQDCPDCGHPDLRLDTDGGVSFRCPGCDDEFSPRACPECGNPDLQFRLADGRVGSDGDAGIVVACPDCGATGADGIER